MPRKPRTVYKEQAYDLGDGVTVTIKYPSDKKPAMRHDDRVAMISTDPDGFASVVSAPVLHTYAPPVGGGASRRMSPEELAEAAKRLAAGDREEPEGRVKPFSSADAFKAKGINPQILDAITAAAEANA